MAVFIEKKRLKPRAAVVCAAAAISSLMFGSTHAAVTWTGAGGTSWASGGSWSNGSGPLAADTVLLTDAGSINLPFEVTSVLNANRTIGGLSFNNTNGRFHTFDLGTHDLTINGNLNFNLDTGQNTTTTLWNGSLSLSSPFGSISAGRGVSGSSVVTADLSGLTSLTANIREMHVGTSTAGTATGTLTLPNTNFITAQRLFVGSSTSSGDTNGRLNLGINNTILANEITLAKDNAHGRITVAGAGTLVVGSPTQRTLLQMGNQVTNTLNTYTAEWNLGAADVDLHFSNVILGQKNGGSGGAVGNLFGGRSGSISIGDPAARADWYVGQSISGGSAIGTADLNNLTTLQAHLSDLYIGRTIAGSASGTVLLPATSTIDVANNIIIGAGPGDRTSNLTLGQNTTILANQLTVGQDYSHGNIAIRTGGTLDLGSASRHVGMVIGTGNTNTNGQYVGSVDLTGSTLNAHLAHLTVAQKEGGPGTAVGRFFGGNAGAITIGTPERPGNLHVARTLNGGHTNGIVDLSGQGSLTAHLDTFSIGTVVNGSAQGIVKLPDVNWISANTIIIGTGGGNGTSSLALGVNNTILANQITISQHYSHGTVTIPSGGVLNLGSPTQRTSLTMATGVTNTPSSFVGTLDLTNARLIAYLDHVILGDKDNLPGGEIANFIISTRPDNHVEANSIVMGGTRSTGNLHFGGGTFITGSIAAGVGTANFNWTGGQLSVGTFGTPTIPFHLNNTSTGILAPGSAASPIGITTIHGNYTQGSFATTSIDIAGASPGVGNDQVNITGAANLAGTLKLKTLNNFTPSVGQVFPIATYGSRTGKYYFVAPPTLPQNVAFDLDYTTNPNQLAVRMVAPALQTWTAAATTAAFATPANWDSQATPGTSTTATIFRSGGSPQHINVEASTTVHRITVSATDSTVTLHVPQGVKLGVANQLVVGSGGILSGAGEIKGHVVLTSGTIAPAAASGQLSIDGDLLVAEPAAALAFNLADMQQTEQSLLDVSGTLALSGMLRVSAADGFSPALNDTFDLFDAGLMTGAFDALDLPTLTLGLSWDTSSLSTNGSLTVVPEPAAPALLCIGAAGLARRRRRAASARVL